jgi:hypothetical protein
LTNPKDILTTLHLIRAGLVSGVLTKKEVIDWADKVISKDEEPDIFFIDLALSNSKSTKEVVSYFSDYLNFEHPKVPGRPLLGLLYKQYKNQQLNLEQTVRILYRLIFEAIFTDKEESYIYSIDDDLYCAENNIYGKIEDVKKETDKFLSFYKDYSIDNFEQWNDLDKIVEENIEKDYQLHHQQNKVYPQTSVKERKP